VPEARFSSVTDVLPVHLTVRAQLVPPEERASLPRTVAGTNHREVLVIPRAHDIMEKYAIEGAAP
jgi:hypothetical protein